MSRTRFRVNPHSIVAPASSKVFLDIQATIQASLLALIILPLLFFKFKISCQSHFEILDLFLKLSLEKLSFCENYRFQSTVLVLRMTEVGFVFKERGVRCILFRVLWKKFYEPKFSSKILNFFSIIGKLRCRVDVNFKPLLKIWICQGVKLTLDKLKTLVCIISSFFGLLLLHTGHGEKNHLLRSYLNFLQLVSERLAYFAQLWYVHVVSHYYWSRLRNNFEFLPSLLIVLAFTFPIVFRVYTFLRFIFFSNLVHHVETWRSFVQVTFLFSIKDFGWFFFFYLEVSLSSNSISCYKYRFNSLF